MNLIVGVDLRKFLIEFDEHRIPALAAGDPPSPSLGDTGHYPAKTGLVLPCVLGNVNGVEYRVQIDFRHFLSRLVGH